MINIDYKELIGAALGFTAVWLATRQNAFYWVLSMFSVLLYSFVLFEHKLYSDTILHIVYFLFSIYGFYLWTRKKEGKIILHVSTLTFNELLVWVLIITGCSVLLGFIFDNFTDAHAPYIDNFCTSASLVGTYWQSKKKIENWPLWVVVNITYIFLYIHRGLYISSLLYLLYVVLAIIGWRNWFVSLIEDRKIRS
ncbi:MAG: nicotinamide riboside transporter PnuC [Solitalea-like symbiont of Acarus siro]